MHYLLGKMRVNDIMVEDPITLDPDIQIKIFTSASLGKASSHQVPR